jgi:uncharacterized membrane protein YcaP (DUF421 family)
VKLAMVETDGVVSVIRHDWAEPVQRADLGGEAAKEKQAAEEQAKAAGRA